MTTMFKQFEGNFKITVENSQYFIAGPAKSESGARTLVSFVGYRVERTSSRAGVAPSEVRGISRRTFSPTTVAAGQL
jgi:hypothetical protein